MAINIPILFYDSELYTVLFKYVLTNYIIYSMIVRHNIHRVRSETLYKKN